MGHNIVCETCNEGLVVKKVIKVLYTINKNVFLHPIL